MIYRLAELDGKLAMRDASQMRGIGQRLFPRSLLERRTGGTVIVEFVIRTDGTIDVSTVRVLESPHELLTRASIEIVKALRFEPGRYDGKPVEVLIQVPIPWTPWKWLARRLRPGTAPLLGTAR